MKSARPSMRVRSIRGLAAIGPKALCTLALRTKALRTLELSKRGLGSLGRSSLDVSCLRASLLGLSLLGLLGLSLTSMSLMNVVSAQAPSSVATPSAQLATKIESMVQRGPVSAQVRLSTETVSIGQSVELTLSVTAPDGVELIMPAFGESFGQFTILDFAPTTTVDADGQVNLQQRYELLMDRSGSRRLTPILIEFVDRRPDAKATPEGEDAYELVTAALRVNVMTGADAAGAQPPLVPPLGALAERSFVQREPVTVAALIALVVLVVAGLAVAWWLVSRRGAPPESAYAIAARQLAQVGALPRTNAAELDQFFVALSAIVRTYVENQFGLHAPELTTEEFLVNSRNNRQLTSADRKFLGEFLTVADRVKFAGFMPESSDVDTALDAVTTFLQRTGRDVDTTQSVNTPPTNSDSAAAHPNSQPKSHPGSRPTSAPTSAIGTSHD